MNYYSMPRVKKRNTLIEPTIGRVCNKPKSFLFDFTARVANVPDTFVPPSLNEICANGSSTTYVGYAIAVRQLIDVAKRGPTRRRYNMHHII